MGSKVATDQTAKVSCHHVMILNKNRLPVVRMTISYDVSSDRMMAIEHDGNSMMFIEHDGQ